MLRETTRDDFDAERSREKFKRTEERGVWNSQPPERRRRAHALSSSNYNIRGLATYQATPKILYTIYDPLAKSRRWSKVFRFKMMLLDSFFFI